MSDTIITSSNFTNAVVQLWAGVALEALKPNFVMANLVNRAYDTNPGSVGSTVTVTYPPKDVTSTVNLAEGDSIQLDADNLSTSAITVNQHTTKSFMIPQASQNLLSVDLARTYLTPYVTAVARKIETTLLGLYTGFSNAAIGTGGTAATSSLINLAETALFNAEVPVSEEKYLIVDGNNYETLRALTELSYQYAFGQNDQLHTGSPDGFKAFGLNIKRSQLVKQTTAGSPAVTTNHGIAFAKDAMCLVTRRLPDPLPGTGTVAAQIEMDGFTMRLLHTFNSSKIGPQFTIDVLWGAAVLRPDFGIEVKM